MESFFNSAKYSKVILIAIFLVTLLGLFKLKDLEFNFDIENFFPLNDPELVHYKNFTNRFNASIDDEYIFIGLTSKQGIFNRNFLGKVDSLTRYLERLDNITSVYSLTNLTRFYALNGELFQDPIVHVHSPEKHEGDSLYLIKSEEYAKLLLSKDRQSVAVSAFNKKNLTTAQKDQLILEINEKLKELSFDESYFSAKIIIEKTYVDETIRNLKIYLIASFIIIGLSLFLLFRSLRDVLIPFLCIFISISMTLSLIVLFDYPLDIITSLLPPILVIICMSDIIHITVKFNEELNSGISRSAAISKTFKDIGLATFFTSLTTAIGFFSLCITNIEPVRVFGLFAGVGVLIAYFVTIGFLWAVFTNTNYHPVRSAAFSGWNKFLQYSFRNVIKHRVAIYILFMLIGFCSIYYLRKIEINSSILMEIPKNNPVLKEFMFIEEQFAGTRSFEVELSMIDSGLSFYDLKLLNEISEFAAFAEDSLGVGFLISPASFFKSANKVFMGGDNQYYTLPKSQKDINYYYNYMVKSQWKSELSRYITGNGDFARISGKLPDLKIRDFKILAEKLNHFHRAQKASFNYKITGSSVLFDKVAYSLTRNLFQGIAIGLFLISLIGYFMFRSLRMAIIIVVPNIIPLLLMAALMGGLGIYLKADTSIIFSIALGIAVDDTIHLISKFKLELARGISIPLALKRTYLTTGKAMVITTLVLFAGFMTLLFSSFGGTFYIGLLVSTCLVFALIADLTLTPLLILRFYKK